MSTLKKAITATLMAAMFSAAASAVNANDAVKDLFGAFLGGAVQNAAQAKWKEIPSEKLQCMQIGVTSKNVKIEDLIKKGIMPDDKRLQAFHKVCDTVLNQKLRKNYSCTLKDPSGNAVQTLCDEYIVTLKNGAADQVVNKMQAATALFSGGKISLYNKMTDAETAKYAASQRKVQQPQQAQRKDQKQAKKQAKEQIIKASKKEKNKATYEKKFLLVLEKMRDAGGGDWCKIDYRMKGLSDDVLNSAWLELWIWGDYRKAPLQSYDIHLRGVAPMTFKRGLGDEFIKDMKCRDIRKISIKGLSLQLELNGGKYSTNGATADLFLTSIKTISEVPGVEFENNYPQH